MAVQIESGSDTGGLRRTLGPVSLGAFGVATIVGGGIFVLVGQAASEFAGPAVALSFALAGVAAGLAALCYAELAAALPVTGSTYTYVGTALGPFAGWIVGWSILLEYVLGGAAIASGWSGYLDGLLVSLGAELPTALTAGPFQDGDSGVANVPALALIVALVLLLFRGVSESARATTLMTAVKLSVLALFVGVGVFHVASANYEPFVPPGDGFGHFGASGILRGAGVVFFAYIGFDVVCTAAQEARDPQRTVPLGLLGALLVATLAYIAVAIVLVGLADYRVLGVDNPLSAALGQVDGLAWLARTVETAALLGLAAGVLAVLYGQSRIFMRMGQDGALPQRIARIDAGSQVPRTATLAGGIAMLAAAALLPLSTLADLISAGTLLAFFVVAISVLVLRRRHPDLERPFQVPFGSLVPVLAALVCIGVLLTLPVTALLRLIVWMAIGLAIYLAYSRAHMRDPRRALDERPM